MNKTNLKEADGIPPITGVIDSSQERQISTAIGNLHFVGKATSSQQTATAAAISIDLWPTGCARRCRQG